MKKTISLLTAVLLLICPVCSVSAYADGNPAPCIKASVQFVNEERTASAVAVYTSDFGDSSKTKGKCIELIVDPDGTVVSVESKGDNAIPKDGFVISAGSSASNAFSGVSSGDKAFFDSGRKIITVVPKDYNPFRTTVLQFDGINTARREDTVIIYRNKPTTDTNAWGYEVCVNSEGFIVSVGGNNNPIPDGGFVVSAVGTKKQTLTDACELGMKVSLDESAKTLTVSYEAENATDGYFMQYEVMKSEYESKKRRYLDIDDEAASSALESMRALCAEIKTALEEDNIPEFVALTNAFETDAKAFSASVIPYNPVEARTVWLRIPTNKSRSVVKKTVKDIYDLGFNTVCIEALFDSTTIMPMPEESLFEQNPAFGGEDMLKLYIDAFHEYGIEVHLWMSCYRVGYTGSGNTLRSVGSKKPEWLNLDQNGKDTVYNEFGNGYFLNPALPEVKEFLLDTYKYILENYAIDGFQLDYIRYPENSTVNYGYDEYTKQKFIEKYGYGSVPTSSSQAGFGEWCEFRAAFVTDLVRSVGALIKEIRPDVVFSCDVAPDYSSTKTKMCQDTVTWLKEALVDMIYPMAYGTTDAVKKWTGITAESAGDDVYVVMGLRDNGAEIYREQITESFGMGADGTAFFAYNQFISGDYRGYIDTTVFSKRAVSPTYSAKDAVSAQLAHTRKTINERILASDAPDEIKAFSDSFVSLADALGSVGNKLNGSDIATSLGEINDALNQGNDLIASLKKSESEACGYAAEYLERALGIIGKAVKNSKDSAKSEYRAAHADKSEDDSSAEESQDDAKAETSWSDKVFQIFFIAVMTIGLVGLPAYFVLENRRKRILRESENDNDNENDNENETPDGENDDIGQ